MEFKKYNTQPNNAVSLLFDRDGGNFRVSVNVGQDSLLDSLPIPQDIIAEIKTQVWTEEVRADRASFLVQQETEEAARKAESDIKAAQETERKQQEQAALVESIKQSIIADIQSGALQV